MSVMLTCVTDSKINAIKTLRTVTGQNLREGVASIEAGLIFHDMALLDTFLERFQSQWQIDWPEKKHQMPIWKVAHHRRSSVPQVIERVAC